MDNDGLDRNDSNLDESWTDDLRPSFDSSDSQESQRENAINAAKDSESSAIKQNSDEPESGSALGKAKQAEKTPGHNFKNSVKGKKGPSIGKGAKFKKYGKKYAPIGSIAGLMIPLMLLMSGSSILAPLSFLQNGINQFNGGMRSSMMRRSKPLMRRALSSDGRHQNMLKGGIFSDSKFKIGNRLSKQLAKNDIKFSEIEGTDGKKLRILHHVDASGEQIVVTANKKDLTRLPDKIKIGDKKLKVSESFVYGSRHANPSKLRKSFDTNLEIGTRNIKGHIAGWFDNSARILLKKLKISRNRFKDVKESDSDEKIKKAAKSEGLSTEVEESNWDRKLDGEGDTKIDPKDGESDALDPSKASKAEVEGALTTRAKAAAAAAGGIGCAIVQSANAVNLTLGALQLAQVINFTSGFLEAISSVKAGSGGGRVIHFYMNGLSKRAHTNVFKGERKVHLRNTPTSSMESPAFNQFFSDGKYVLNSSDLGAQKFNREQVMAKALKNKGLFGKFLSNFSNGLTSDNAYTACMGANFAESLLSIISIGTGGLEGAALKTLLSAGIQALISRTVPLVAEMLKMDLIEKAGGEDAAYAINSGFQFITNKNFQLSTGKPGTKSEVVSQYRQAESMIAEDAKIDRATHSPLDYTNKNTFLGSLAYQLLPLGFMAHSPLRFMGRFNQITTQSLYSLSPQASAANKESNFKGSLNSNCPSLKEIGAVGDAFCNPYIVSDSSTVNEDPADVFIKVNAKDPSNFEDDEENPSIREGSDLAKWVTSCAMRESNFGNIDPGLTGGDLPFGEAANLTINSLPVLGDLADLYSGAKFTENYNWANGKNCADPAYKYYSRYSEDQRIMEAMGIIDQSAVTAYAEKQEKKHPLDNSREGVLARLSGLSKSQVSSVLGLIEYQTYLAKYRKTQRSEKEISQKSNFKLKTNPTKLDSIIAKTPIILNAQKISLPNLRNRAVLV